jgi:transposase InsO family protein
VAEVLHGSARTTPRVRAELQRSQESTRALAARYSLNPKTVAKWRGRTTTADAPMGPSDPRSTVLTPVEEAMIVEFRRRTLLPLDDVLGCLRDTLPRLTRSALHRCLKRHGISRLPESEDKTSRRGRFAETAIGYVHIDVCELRLAAGKLHMFLAIDRVSKFTYVEFHEHANTTTGPAFLRNVVVAFPYRIRIVLTDNGTPFADLPKNRSGPTARLRGHMFDRVCREHGIEHRLTKPYHPWTNGQAERMNRTIKDATVKAFHYESLESLKDHVLAFVAAYNFAKHLKALRWRTPFEAIQDAWTNDPSPFKINPHQLIPRPNTRGRSRGAGRSHRGLRRDAERPRGQVLVTCPVSSATVSLRRLPSVLVVALRGAGVQRAGARRPHTPQRPGPLHPETPRFAFPAAQTRPA